MGGITQKLLHKTLKVYLAFSFVIVLVSAPLFYIVTERLFIADADEALVLHQKEFFTNVLPAVGEADIAIWNRISRDVKIEPASLLKKDTIYYRFFMDTLANENEPYRVLLSPITIEGKSFTLMARVNLIESEDLIVSIAVLFCLVLVILLTGLYFITRRLSVRLWLPFYSTLQQVEQFELDKNVKPDFKATDVEEFARLNQSINRLLEKNISAYKNQKEFIENAAHELQTPVAVFQAKLDSLAQQLSFTTELSNVLSDLNDSVSRLARINKNLLLLSRIENDQFPDMGQVVLHEVIKKQVDFLTEQAEARNIDVRLEQNQSLTLHANATLLELAVSNLLLNALRYNRDHGRIVVTLRDNQLTISSTGMQAALDHEKLFKRFSTGGSEAGSGLGLAIVKKICELHGWHITYMHEGEMHHFTLSF